MSGNILVTKAFTINDEMHNEIKKIAEAQDISASKLMRNIIKSYLEVRTNKRLKKQIKTGV